MMTLVMFMRCFLAVTGEGYSLTEIKDYLDILERELLQVPGVARVATLGRAPKKRYLLKLPQLKPRNWVSAQDEI